MFSIEVLENWFEAQCGAEKPCAKFYAIDDENAKIISDLKGNLSGITLVLFQPQIKSEGPDVDTISDIYRGMIFVIKYSSDKNGNRFENRQTERRETFNAMMKVRQSIIDQARTPACHFWRFLRHDSFEMNRVGPVFDGFWGWSLDFDFTINTDAYESF